MAIFKRFEVWMLLIFVSAGIGFVLFTQTRQQEDEEIVTTEDGKIIKAPKNGKTDLPFTIQHTQLRPEGESAWLLELDVLYTNETEADVRLDFPQAKLVTDSGADVPEFFLAFAQAPVIEPNAEKVVQLRYWLQPQHRDQDLWLQILGERSKVDLAFLETAMDPDPSS